MAGKGHQTHRSMLPSRQSGVPYLSNFPAPNALVCEKEIRELVSALAAVAYSWQLIAKGRVGTVWVGLGWVGLGRVGFVSVGLGLHRYILG